MMQEKAKKYAKLCQNSPKLCKIVQQTNYAFFFAYKALLSLKKTVKIDVSTYESVQ